MSELANCRRIAGRVVNWLLLPSLVSVGLAACMTSGLGSRGSVTTHQRAVQELFVGPGQLQYYLVPQQLLGPVGQYASLDLVVRDSAHVLRHGLLHLSVLSPVALVPATDTLLLGTSGLVVAVATRLLYTEPKGKAIESRLEAQLTPAQLVAYLRSPAKNLYLGGAAGRRSFVPDAKALRNLQVFSTQAIGAATQ